MYIARLWVSFSCDFSMVWVSGAGSSYIFEVLIPYMVRIMYIARLWVSFSCDFSMVWVPGAGLSYIFEVLIPYRQEYAHCKVAGFIFL